jgi:hypothetical protein
MCRISACSTERRSEGRDGAASDLPAPISRAVRNGSGKRLPRLSARSKTPSHAFWLKKYFSGTFPANKTSDNEHSLATLGDSEELSVQHSVGEPIPEVAQRPEDGTHVPSSVR